MGELRRWYIVSYDVRDPKRLRRVHELVSGYGSRLQLSVFRCWLTDREREKMRWELAKEMAPEDELLLIGLCPDCVNRIVATNPKKAWPDPPAPFRIL